MDRDSILRRRAELKMSLRRLELDLAATDGAIQDCDYWLNRLAGFADKAEAEKAEDVPLTEAEHDLQRS